MNIDLVGRIKNVTLPYSKPLLPLFEAVINSFDAIEDGSMGRSGRISITIRRDTTQTRMEIGGSAEIVGFDVEDNGVGFTYTNFNSFLTSDTEYKLAKGGKGVGRFLWLKAFGEVDIESEYLQDDNWQSRRFKFRLSEEGVEGGEPESLETAAPLTKVHLRDFKEKYAKNCPKKAKTIAFRLIEHCLAPFIEQNCPTIFLVDGDESLSLNEIFSTNYKRSAENRGISIDGTTFDLLGLRLTSSEEQHHRLHLCANGREVSSLNLIPRIQNLTAKLQDEAGGDFHFVCYVSGEYLDDNVNQERTAFAFPEESGNDLVHSISVEDICRESCKEITDILQPYLEPIRIRKKEKIG